ncbi:hypothetical protein TMO_c0613 (plasmid) [Tistrella mobilis KA081020-065]|uniref:Uncharacterized protein n=1 Tax=Tistrella mobilis (strain KA081020-065) TaxID=1110502 RepID=I3TWT5_TISMK|nr:hypothetical protein TMO_c0613 [Tistrella mobilis KA081020-065]
MKKSRKVHINKILISEMALIFGQVQGRPAWRRHGQDFGGRMKLPEEFMLGFHSFHAADENSGNEIIAR